MTIIRTEEVLYHVADIDASARYCADFGLRPLEPDGHAARFATGTGQVIAIDPAGEGEESGIARIVWGVDTAQALAAIRAEMARDRAVVDEPDGGFLTSDETGFVIGFRLASVETPTAERRPVNSFGQVERWNDRLGTYDRARPLRIAHVALDIPKQGKDEAVAFYTGRLGFKAVETIAPTGTFLQAEGETDHHQLFLCHRTDRKGTNHVAFEVRDFDEVVEGGNHLVSQGWKETRRLGRHTVGSNIFRFFATPMGGRFEYVADMDQVRKEEPHRHWETSPPHHLWMLKTNGQD